MAWKDITKISDAWDGEGGILKADIVLQINVINSDPDTLTATYNLRMICVKDSSSQAVSGTSNDNDLWIGPSEFVPANKDKVGNFKSGEYYKREAGIITWYNNSVMFEVDNLTATYNSDGTLTKSFGIAAWTGTFTFCNSFANYTFPVLDVGGKVSIKTANGWKKGQVFVKTSDGWKKAKAVFVKTSDGWKKAK